jgi:hypothetical protein
MAYVLSMHTRLNCICYINALLQEEFEDTNQKHNGQKKKYKRTNNDQTKHTHKAKDRVT